MEMAEIGAEIEKHKAEFETYYSQLIEANQRVNLTAITQHKEVFVKHFLDSILPIAEIKPNASVVDVGSGAGFPGLPIKIVRPDVKLTLVDSLNKRTAFLTALTHTLFPNTNPDHVIAKGFSPVAISTSSISSSSQNEISIFHSRAEEFCAHSREKFDTAVARAVAKLNTLVEYLLPLVRVGGTVLAYKGSDYLTELASSQNAIKTLGGEYVKTLHFTLPFDMGERNIIVIKKVRPTPKQYPRAQNKPKTQPL